MHRRITSSARSVARATATAVAPAARRVPLPGRLPASATRRQQHFSSSSVVRAAAATGSSPKATNSASELTVTLPTGEQTSFHHVWLRDHCRDERSYHPATKQRLVDTYLIPADITPLNVVAGTEGITVTWPESKGSGSSYDSFFPWSFLVEHSYYPPLKPQAPSPLDKKVLWTSAISKDPPTVSYEEIMNSEVGVYEWVKRIDTYGFSLVSGIPSTPEATESLIRRIAFIRETHYGGFWDFTADLKHGDLAYSDVLLQGHTDTTYFTDPCGLQLFHLLSPSSSHIGGHNLLVDGFRAAVEFRRLHPTFYSLFSSLPIPSHASGTGSDSIPSGVHMTPLSRKPVFNHDERGELVQVRWNGDDRGVVGGSGFEGKMEDWYEGLRLWEGMLRSEEATLWSEMVTGTAVIFDNHRVMHGRSSFTGERRLCGAYVNHDDFRSRLRGLEKQFGPKDDTRGKLLSKFGLKGGNLEGVWADYSV